MSVDPFAALWLKGNSSAALELLKRTAVTVDLSRGGTVYGLGTLQKSLWGVLSGQVRVFVATNELQPALGHIHAPGAWFGEVESVLNVASYVQMEADTDTRLVKIDLSKYRKIANNHPMLWESIARLAAFNLWYATCVANDMALRQPRQRLAASVLRLAGYRAATQGNPPIDSLRASQQEIAVLSNVARTTASKILHECQEDQILRLDYGRIVVLDAARLAATLEQ